MALLKHNMIGDNMELLVNDVKVDENTRIDFAPNPKRSSGKAWARYEVYCTAATVGEYFDLANSKYAKADLRYDHEKGFLIFTNEELDDAETPMEELDDEVTEDWNNENPTVETEK